VSVVVGPRRRVAYPTNHLLAVIDHAASADAAVEALRAAGVTESDVTVLRGAGGGGAIGGLGARHRWLTTAIRAVQYLTMDQMPDFGRYEEAIAEGRTVIAVHATDRRRMLDARAVLVAHGAHFLNFYGRVATEELGRWRDPDDGWIDRPFPEAEARTGRR
jgi:hypothetical protein